jgi:hypothetical protein
VDSSRGRWTRAALIAATLAICAIAATGCGGTESSGGGGDAEAQFNRALGPNGVGKLDSGNLDLSVKVDVNRGDQSGSFDLGLSGPFQSGKNGGADLHLTGDSSFAGNEGSFDLGLVSAGENFYVKYGGQTYEIGAAQLKRLGALNGTRPTGALGFRQVCRMQFQQSGGDPAVCDQIHPGSWIDDFTNEGQEDVGGVQTDHLKAEIDVHSLVVDLFQLGKSITARQGVPLGAFDPDRIADQADQYVDKAEVSANPGPDGIPRKLGLDLSIDAGDMGGVDVTVDAAFDHVNEPQAIAPPPGPIQPIQALAKQLPPPFQALVSCLLNSKSQAELQSCAAGVGTQDAIGVGGSSSLN